MEDRFHGRAGRKANLQDPATALCHRRDRGVRAGETARRKPRERPHGRANSEQTLINDAELSGLPWPRYGRHRLLAAWSFSSFLRTAIGIWFANKTGRGGGLPAYALLQVLQDIIFVQVVVAREACQRQRNNV